MNIFRSKCGTKKLGRDIRNLSFLSNLAFLKIAVILRKENLTTVYLCTDAPIAEVTALINLLPSNIQVERFLNDSSLNDGQVSIVDQVLYFSDL